MRPTLPLLASLGLTTAVRVKLTNYCPLPLVITTVHASPSSLTPAPQTLDSASAAGRNIFLALDLTGQGVAVKARRLPSSSSSSSSPDPSAEVILGFSESETEPGRVYYSLDQIHGELFPGSSTAAPNATTTATTTHVVGVWGPVTGECRDIAWTGGRRPEGDIVSSCVLDAGRGGELRVEFCAAGRG